MTEDVNIAISQALRKAAGLLVPIEIQEKRKALGLTQKQLAERLLVADATISRWETGAVSSSTSQRARSTVLLGFRAATRKALVRTSPRTL